MPEIRASVRPSGDRAGSAASLIGPVGWANAALLGVTLTRRGHFHADARLRKNLLFIVVLSLVMGAAVAALIAGEGYQRIIIDPVAVAVPIAKLVANCVAF